MRLMIDGVKNKDSIILTGILLLSLLLRVTNLSSDPPSLNQDEAVNGYDAFTLGTNLRDHHGNLLPIMLQSFGDWVSPLLTYITIPFVKLFGLSVFSIRIVTALLGVGTVYLVNIFLRQILKRRDLALLGAFLLAISPWQITLSRWAIPPSIVPFFLLLFLCTFLWAYKKQEKTNSVCQYIIPGVCAGLLVYSYPTQKLFVPILVLSTVIIYLRKNIKAALIFLITFGIMVAPIYILTIANPIYNARFNDVSIMSSPNLINEFTSRYVEYFLPYFHFGSGDKDVMHQVPGFGNSYEFLSLFFYLGILICVLGVAKKIVIKNVDNKTYQLLLVWLCLFPVAASLTRDHNMVLRVIHGLPLVVIFFILTCSYIWQFIKKKSAAFLIGAVVLIGMISLWGFSKYYFGRYRSVAYLPFQYGVSQYTEFLLRNEDKFDKVVIDRNINQPYIYYLFFSHFDPHKLNYLSPKNSSPKYIFGEVSKAVAEKLPVYTAKYNDIEMYGVYADGSVWYVLKLF